MKHTKKLIPALGMLLLSACMLVTSTFAWFAMNETVSATGMSVTAKGDQVYLQIINPDQDGAATVGHDKEFVSGKLQNTSVAKNSGSALLPTNVYKTFDAQSPVAYDGGADMVWVKATGTAVNDYEKNDEGYTKITSDPQGIYYLKNTFQIRLDPTAGAESSSAPLKVRAVTLTGDTVDQFEDSLCVLVVCTYESTVQGDLWSYVEGGEGTSTFQHTDGTSATLTTGNMLKNKVATVDIYVFFNGDNPNCDLETLAAAKNTNYSVAVEFTVV